jgi:mRNA interferase MazF
LPTTDPKAIKRGEIWKVNLDPAVGDEIKKSRPCIVVNSDAVGILRIKLVAPLTEWNDSFNNRIWFVKINPDGKNGLNKVSAVDVLQLRGVSVDRFIENEGSASSEIMEEIATAIAAIVEYQ